MERQVLVSDMQLPSVPPLCRVVELSGAGSNAELTVPSSSSRHGLDAAGRAACIPEPGGCFLAGIGAPAPHWRAANELVACRDGCGLAQR